MKLANPKTKEAMQRVARGKGFLTYGGRNIRITSDLSTETWQARKGRVINEKKMEPSTLFSNAIIQNGRRDKEFPG